MKIDAVQKESLGRQVYMALRKAILCGQIRRHKTYSVNQLAQILNVSRTPVVSAVQILSKERLISIFPNQGFRVYEFLAEEVRQIFELRKAVEGYVVERVIEIDADISEICKYLDSQKGYLGKKDIVPFLREDRNFHIGLAKKLNNPHIVQVLSNIRDLLNIMNWEVMAERERGEQVIKEHACILETIDAKKKKSAKEALYYHFDNTVKILARRIVKTEMSG